MTAVQTTRARSNGEIAREQGRPRDRRVLRCAHLLAAGRLDTQTRRELAEEWGLKPKSIDQMASEAGTYLRLIGEREAMLEFCVSKLSEWVDEGDRDRVPAMKLLAEVKGLLEQRPTAVQVNVGTSALPPEEQAQRALRDPVFRSQVKRWIAEIEAADPAGGVTSQQHP